MSSSTVSYTTSSCHCVAIHRRGRNNATKKKRIHFLIYKNGWKVSTSAFLESLYTGCGNIAVRIWLLSAKRVLAWSGTDDGCLVLDHKLQSNSSQRDSWDHSSIVSQHWRPLYTLYTLIDMVVLFLCTTALECLITLTMIFSRDYTTCVHSWTTVSVECAWDDIRKHSSSFYSCYHLFV